MITMMVLVLMMVAAAAVLTNKDRVVHRTPELDEDGEGEKWNEM